MTYYATLVDKCKAIYANPMICLSGLLWFMISTIFLPFPLAMWIASSTKIIRFNFCPWIFLRILSCYTFFLEVTSFWRNRSLLLVISIFNPPFIRCYLWLEFSYLEVPWKKSLLGCLLLCNITKKFYTVNAQVACTANVFYNANLLKVIFGGKKDYKYSQTKGFYYGCLINS